MPLVKKVFMNAGHFMVDVKIKVYKDLEAINSRNLTENNSPKTSP